MGSSINSNPSSNFVQRKHFSVERRPKLLKDFLTDDPNSCSSSGFKSFPRKPLTPVEVDSTNINIARNPLARSRSKAASSTISALQAMINAVRSIHFSAVKPPSILPRSLSRKLSKKSLRGQRRRSGGNKENIKVKTTAFTVKDIMRWRSFHDLVEVKSAPLDCLTSSPHQCCTTSTTTTTTTTSGSPSSTTPRSSNGSSSSWCDIDFTSEYLPCWVDGNKSEDVVEVGKKDLPFVGEENSEESTTGARTSCYGAEGPTEEEEKEQLSPVCVIDFEFDEDEEESSSSFDHSLASVERAQQKLMDKIRRFESLAKLDPINLDQEWMSMDENNLSSAEDYDHLEEEEEIGTGISYQEEEANCEIEDKAWQLLNDVKVGNTTLWSCKNNEEDQLLLLEFFRDELLTQKRSKCRISFEFELELVSRGKRWMNGEDGMWVGWEVEKKREAHFCEMSKAGDWSKFEEEKEEVGFVIENLMVDFLVDELLLDLIMMYSLRS